jgi:hypothetical protein
MNEFEAAFFYGDYRILRELARKLLSQNDQAMWVQQELFS